MSSPARIRPHRGLQFIAAFKFVKAAVLVTAGLGALGFLSPARSAMAEDWLEGLALRQGHHFIAAWAERAGDFLSVASARRLVELAIGAFLYAGLFVVEGVGLARARRWAEYLTVIATSSYLPFEVMALVHRPTLAPAATIVLNVAVVIYLVIQLRTPTGSPEWGETSPGPERPAGHA